MVKFLKSNIFLLKRFSGLHLLNDEERRGIYRFTTSVKFLYQTPINLPYSNGRTIRGLSFRDNLCEDAMGRFCLDIVHGKPRHDCVEALHLAIKRESAASAALVASLPGNLQLSVYPGWALVLPWERQTLRDRYETYKQQFEKSRASFLAKGTGSSVGESFLYSKEVAESHWVQTNKLYKSIQMHGYRRRLNLPRAIVLVDNDRWVWLMAGEGNHRACIQAARGAFSLECAVTKIIDREAVKRWPNVRNGLYSRTEALQVFDNAFSGNASIRGLI